jgi:uncharacterized protein YndB with AHSA1/START domain
MNDRSPDLMTEAASRALTIVRVLDAPRASVYQAFTDPLQLLQWYGPRHHPATSFEIDCRPGGKFRACLRSVETGKELRHGGVFREVVPGERLVYSFAWDQEDGTSGPETLVTVVFEDVGSKTRMTFQQRVFDTTENRDGHVEGWTSSFSRLDEFLAKA